MGRLTRFAGRVGAGAGMVAVLAVVGLPVVVCAGLPLVAAPAVGAVVLVVMG